MKSFQQFMKENEAQDDKMDTAIQDAENKKDAYLKRKGKRKRIRRQKKDSRELLILKRVFLISNNSNNSIDTCVIILLQITILCSV